MTPVHYAPNTRKERGSKKMDLPRSHPYCTFSCMNVPLCGDSALGRHRLTYFYGLPSVRYLAGSLPAGRQAPGS